MKQKFNILIADRNPHVREFLKRELSAEGYRVLLAENGRQLIKLALNNRNIDLLIMDPDLPDTDISSLLTELRNRIRLLPVVVHTFLSDYTEHADLWDKIHFIEKRGSSVEHLKKVVFDILQKPNKERSQTASGHGPHPVGQG